MNKWYKLLILMHECRTQHKMIEGGERKRERDRDRDRKPTK